MVITQHGIWLRNELVAVTLWINEALQSWRNISVFPIVLGEKNYQFCFLISILLCSLMLCPVSVRIIVSWLDQIQSLIVAE